VISAIILAAGRSTRFGRDKRLELMGDTPMFLHTALKLKRCVADTLVVLAAADARHQRLAAGLGVETTLCADAASGMGHSLAHAVAQRPDAEGWLVMPADMPFIQAATVQRVLEAAGVHALAAPVFEGRRGHPVWFAGRYRGALCALTGDEGARSILKSAGAGGDGLHLVEVDDPGCVLDVDRPGDLALL
jgi:molybdenum cofactor cytidylyltransferase